MTKDTDGMAAEEVLSQANSMIRQAYYSDVRDYAREIVQSVKDGEISDRDELYTRVSETVDGTQWVIYTHKAMAVLMASDNDGAYLDEYGAEGLIDGGALNWSRMAFAAMERDMFEQLDAEGLDVNGETPREMLKLEEEE